MKVKVEFEDTSALTASEIEKGLKLSYGENTKVGNASEAREIRSTSSKQDQRK